MSPPYFVSGDGDSSFYSISSDNLEGAVYDKEVLLPVCLSGVCVWGEVCVCVCVGCVCVQGVGIISIMKK